MLVCDTHARFPDGALCRPRSPAPIPPSRLAGHWEGAIHAPAEDVAVAVDLAADETASFAARSAARRSGSTAFRFGARTSTAKP